MSRDGFVARRVAAVAPVVQFLEPDEPRTTRALSEHLSGGGTRWCRTWLIGAPDGAPVGAVVVSKLCFDQWVGWVHLRDPRAAPVAAELVQRSPAWSVTGREVDIEPLAPLVPRSREISRRRWGYAAAPIGILGAPDERTRLATRADLPALVELYAGYELGGPATRWQLREYLGRIIHRHFVVVHEDAGRLVGAIAVDGRTRRFVAMNDLTVVPEHRRSGVAWAILARVQAIADGMGLGATWTMAASNPMHHTEARWGEEQVCVLHLAAPHRFRGEGRLRRLYHGRQPITNRRRLPPGDDAASPE